MWKLSLSLKLEWKLRRFFRTPFFIWGLRYTMVIDGMLLRYSDIVLVIFVAQIIQIFYYGKERKKKLGYEVIAYI